MSDHRNMTKDFYKAVEAGVLTKWRSLEEEIQATMFALTLHRRFGTDPDHAVRVVNFLYFSGGRSGQPRPKTVDGLNSLVGADLRRFVDSETKQPDVLRSFSPSPIQWAILRDARIEVAMDDGVDQ